MKTILYFHQSAELYGSDKTLLQLVIGMSEKGHKVIVVIPEEGPLTAEFKDSKIEYIVNPVLKLSRDMFSPKKLFLFIYHFFTSIKTVRRKTKNLNIDLIHSNTLAVLLGAFYAKLFRIKHIWHVHEIIQHPKVIRLIYIFLLKNFSSIIVFNSRATANHWGISKTPQHIVHNGIENLFTQLTANEILTLKKEKLNLNTESIIITLIGRISRLKGQKLLLKAFENACLDKENCVLLYVGGPPSGQEYFQTELQELIKSSPKRESIHILPHQKDINKIYAITDIVVIPSTEPESFGMIALEAMIAKKPVLVAGHGGLLEIIEHNKSGLVFKASNEKALSQELLRLIEDSNLRKKLVLKANERVIKEFPLNKYIDSFDQIYTESC